MLRLDTNFYSSTKHELTHLYPRLSGVLIVDDYGAYQGSRLATDEYFRHNNMKILLSRVDEKRA
jgi:O-methyltransferase